MKYGAFLNSIKNPNYYYINYNYIKMIIKNNDQNFLCELNIDISTVSRASNGKYVQLPWGIFEIRDFFSESIKTKSGKEVSNSVVKNRIKDIISNEDKSNPYDDQSIVSILEKEDYIVARRTVSKYRSLMGIAKSKLRREITDE